LLFAIELFRFTIESGNLSDRGFVILRRIERTVTPTLIEARDLGDDFTQALVEGRNA